MPGRVVSPGNGDEMRSTGRGGSIVLNMLGPSLELFFSKQSAGLCVADKGFYTPQQPLLLLARLDAQVVLLRD